MLWFANQTTRQRENTKKDSRGNRKMGESKPRTNTMLPLSSSMPTKSLTQLTQTIQICDPNPQMQSAQLKSCGDHILKTRLIHLWHGSQSVLLSNNYMQMHYDLRESHLFMDNYLPILTVSCITLNIQIMQFVKHSEAV